MKNVTPSVLLHAQDGLPQGYARDLIVSLLDADEEFDATIAGDLYRALILTEQWEREEARAVYNSAMSYLHKLPDPDRRLSKKHVQTLLIAVVRGDNNLQEYELGELFRVLVEEQGWSIELARELYDAAVTRFAEVAFAASA